MRTWKISESDVSVRGDGWLNEVKGYERVAQEMACWLLEPVGTDPLYPNFGSRLSEMVGTAIGTGTLEDVRQEVSRVLGNYMSYTKARIEESRTLDATTFMEMWGGGEVLSSIDSVHVEASGDTVRVLVTFSMSDGTQATVEQSVQ